MIHLCTPRLMRASVLVNLFVPFYCVRGANCCRMETLAKLKSTQQLLTEQRRDEDDLPEPVVLALAAPDTSLEFCFFLIGLFSTVQSFFSPSSVASAGSEVVCGSMSSPDFLLKSRP